MKIKELITENHYFVIKASSETKMLNESLINSLVSSYRVTTEQLSSFASERYYSATTGELLDRYENTVYNIYSIPIKIPDEYINSELTPILAGHSFLSTKAYQYKSNKIIVPMGQITVPEEQGNAYDYLDIECKLHFPYNEQPIIIDYEYIVGQTINLELSLDIINANAVLDITSSKINDGLVTRVEIPMTYEIPINSNQRTNSYLKKANSYLTSGVGKNFNINNKTEIPFIELIKPIPYDRLSEFGKASNDYSKLRDIKGYVQVENVKLNIKNSYATEINEINNLLSSGIIID